MGEGRRVKGEESNGMLETVFGEMKFMRFCFKII